MQDFIKEQQRKLDTCLEKLDNLSKEIQKDEEKLDKNAPTQENKENIPISKEDKTEKISKEKNEKTAEKKPSVLKALKENQQKIRQKEQGKGEKIAKKDKGMEL